MRPINADALLEAMKREYKRVYCPWHFETYKDIVNSIANTPTIQHEPINEVYEFEKWLKENTLIRANLNVELDYADPLAEIAYKAWKARSKLNAPTETE